MVFAKCLCTPFQYSVCSLFHSEVTLMASSERPFKKLSFLEFEFIVNIQILRSNPSGDIEYTHAIVVEYLAFVFVFYICSSMNFCV